MVKITSPPQGKTSLLPLVFTGTIIQVRSHSGAGHTRALSYLCVCVCVSCGCPSSVRGDSAGILRLRASTTGRMPPLRLLIMARPFPTGSTLCPPLLHHHHHPPTLVPSSVDQRSHHHGGVLEKGWIPPSRYAQPLQPWPPSDVGSDAVIFFLCVFISS